MARTRATTSTPQPAFPPPAPPIDPEPTHGDSDSVEVPVPTCTCDTARGEGCSYCCTVVDPSSASDEDEDEDYEEEECSGDEDCECADCYPTPRRATRRAVAKKAVPRTATASAKKPASAPTTLANIQNTQSLLAQSLAFHFNEADPKVQDYILVSVEYLTKFIRNRMAQGMYKPLALACEVEKLKASRYELQYIKQTRPGRWDYGSSYYHMALFGEDCLSEWHSDFNPGQCRYQNNVQFWVTTILLSYMLSQDTTNNDGDYPVAKPLRFSHWDIAGTHHEVLYRYKGSQPRVPAGTEPSGDYNDGQDEQEDEEETNTIDCRTHDSRLSFSSGLGLKILACDRNYSILPLVFWKEDIADEATVHLALSRYLSEHRTKYLKPDSAYEAFLMGHCIVEGYHFNVDPSLKGICITDADIDGIEDGFDNDTIETDIRDNEFLKGRSLRSDAITEDFLEDASVASPVVKVGRFYLSPSTALSLCGLHSHLNPVPSSIEEALRLAAEKELASVSRERDTAIYQVTEARKALATANTYLASTNMRYLALSTALQSNLEEAIRRLQPLNLEKIEVTTSGSILLQTGPIFGKFVNAKLQGKTFYVGNFQIIMSVLAPSFSVRNIAAPLVAHADNNGTYAKIVSMIHPHSNDGSKICWGGYSSELQMHHSHSELPIADDFETRVRTLLMFLSTANGDDGYVSKWRSAMLETAPGVTQVTEWDTSMVNGRATLPGRKAYGVQRKEIKKSKITNAFVRTTLGHVPGSSKYLRLESEEGIEWIS